MVDYIIVGGGVYGCAVAWELASRGFEVRLLEAGEIAGRASGGPGRRGVRANGRDRTELPLMEIAYDVWPHLHEKLGSVPFYERTGHLLLMESTEHRAQAKARGWMQRKLGIDTRLVEGEELREMEPGLSPKILAALFCPNDGVADHAATTRAYGVAAKKLGARLDEHCAVTSFALEGGRIQSVTTQNEEQLSVRRGVFLLTNSAVAEQVRQLTGDELPVWNACLQVLVSEPLSILPLRHLIGHMGRTVSLKKEGDDRLMISGGWPGHWDESTQTGRTVHSSVSGNVAETVAVYPALAGMGGAEADASHLEAMSVDDIPIIDRVPGSDNLWFTTGYSGHGWAIAPVIASLLADWGVTGNASPLLAPFSLSRFFPN